MVRSALQQASKSTVKDPVILAHRYSESLDLQPYPFKRYTGTHYLDQAKYVQVRIDPSLVKKWDYIELRHITDVQHGHTLCPIAREIEYRDWVLEEPNRFMLWGGDNVDAWRLGSPGDPYENTAGPSTQVREFCSIWAPAAHRVLGYVGGNHERRACLGFGDLGGLISQILRIPYSAGQQLIDIHFGDWNAFRVDLWHGRGNARTKGAKLNMLHDFMQQSDAHLCLVGHLHDVLSTFRWRRVRDSSNLKPRFEKQAGAMSSSFLEWLGSYAEVAGMPVTECVMASAFVEPNRTWELRLR